MQPSRKKDGAGNGAGRKTGARLVRYALEQLPVTHTFGIPGVHTTELYDELAQSERIRPILVTHEGCGAFAADAVSRTSQGAIGCLAIVPAAGLTHAMSGIAECYLDGIPLLVIAGAPRTDIEFGYQLHEIDSRRLAGGILKGLWSITDHREIVPAIFEAYRTAIRGVPGPVLVEIPVNIQLFQGLVDDLPVFTPQSPSSPATLDASNTSASSSSGAAPLSRAGRPRPASSGVTSAPAAEQTSAVDKELAAAVDLLRDSRSPGIFVGWGAVDVSDSVARIAELLGAPVATTLQGLSAFPGNHPLHAGMGFSRAAIPAAENAFRSCDCLLAIGTSFGEIPTGSFGCRVPDNLIHIDVSPDVIGRNYPPRVGIAADARVAVPRLLALLETAKVNEASRRAAVEARIAADKRAYREIWRAHTGSGVNPLLFFEEMRRQLADDAIATVDDGNHTFLAAELFEVRRPRTFISPTDFNCMGYAVPAAVGAKLANPDRQVVSIVGDGAFLMTGLEITTAVTERLGIAVFVFHDGELSQIAQGQEIPYNRKPCTVLGGLKPSGIAEATGARYVSIEDNSAIAGGIRDALTNTGQNHPVIVDVRIDYSKRTRFTQGVVKTVIKRFPLRDRVRFIARALTRKVTG